MSQIACCFWWLVLGFVLGWLANWLLSKMVPQGSARGDARRRGSCRTRTAAAHHDALISAAAAPPARVIDVGAARAAGFNIKHDDDLTIIEGIGPRIDDLLHAERRRLVRAARAAQRAGDARHPRTRRSALPARESRFVGAPGGARIGEPLGGAQAPAGRAHRRPTDRRHLIRRGGGDEPDASTRRAIRAGRGASPRCSLIVLAMLWLSRARARNRRVLRHVGGCE